MLKEMLRLVSIIVILIDIVGLIDSLIVRLMEEERIVVREK